LSLEERVRRAFGALEDPVKGMVHEVLSVLDPNYRVARVSVERLGRNSLRITALLKPRVEGATISAWRLIEAEERLAARLRVRLELAHTRVGFSPEGLLVVFLIRWSD